MSQATREKIGGITPLVIGGLMGLGFIAAAFYLAGPIAGGVLVLLLAYEGWTLVNNSPEDTISEAMWALSVRPMVPYVFGVTMGTWLHWIVTQPVIRPKQAVLMACMQFLMGHFFFQAQKNQEKAQAGKVAEAAVTGAVAAVEAGRGGS